MNRVLVIMSTYNGEKYVREQINSILMQKNVEVSVLVRDDGSTDGTLEVINGLQDDRITVLNGENMGCEASFFELLMHCKGYEYYAFSDQDDYWEEDKIISAIQGIQTENGPALAACNLWACDEALNPLRLTYDEKSFADLGKQMKRDVLRNVHGCVLLWNDSLNDLLRPNLPKSKVAHDVWVNAVANLLGVVWLDPKPHVRYRLHGDNVSGLATSAWQRLKKGIRLYLGKNHRQMDLVASELLESFGEHADKDSQGYHSLCVIRDYKKSLKTRLELMRQPIICDRPLWDALFWKLCVFLHRF